MATVIGRADLTLVDFNDVTAGLVQPSNPIEGQMFYDKNDNQLYIYTNGGWFESSNHEAYVQSRGENLVTNGTGLLGNNKNFSEFTFDGSEVFAGAGSFFTDAQNAGKSSDELIPVDPSRKYKASYMAKSKLGVGHQYGGFTAYDVDRLSISSAMRIASNFPIVALAQDLKQGDTVMYLTSTDGFTDTSGDDSHVHSLMMWGYKNSYGYEYPAGTYSRHHVRGTWSNGAINQTAKTITFSRPFSLTNPNDPDGIFRTGHKLSKTTDGGTYLYTIAVNVKYPNDKFETFTGLMDGIGDSSTKFPHGTSFLRFLWLTNRSTSGGVAGDAFWLNNVSLTDVTDIKELDDKVINITETLGNMANDNLLDYEERKVIKDKLTDITGVITADATTAILTTASLDSGLKGEFYSVRKSALNAGLVSTDALYIAVATQYNNLRTYLNGMTPIKPWDVRTATQSSTISVVKNTFRTNWFNYYTAINNLATATVEKLKKNVDDVVVGGANYARNGNFGRILTEANWKDEYVGQTSEIVDISTETPPFQFGYHVKNTSNVNGGIHSPVIWTGSEAENLLGKEITISFWMKHQNITVGASAWNAGRFGELVVSGTSSTGATTYLYPRAGIQNADSTNQSSTDNYIIGTDMVWKKYVVTHKLSLPSGAVKLRDITFRHGLLGCVGEFWTTGIQIEVGNKVTDWKYSDLDLQEKFTEVDFKISPDQIVSKVTSSTTYTNDLGAKATQTDINTSIDKIEIGGRNLYVDTNTVSGYESAGAIQPSTEVHRVMQDIVEIIPSKGIIYQVWNPNKIINSSNSNRIGWLNSDKVHISSTSLIMLNGEYQIMTITPPSNARYARIGVIKGASGSTIDKEIIVKIENGSKATDWTPAPKDVDASIDNIEIGGRNIIWNSNFATGDLSSWLNNGSVTYAVVDGKKTAYIGITSGIYQTRTIEEGIQTFSFSAKALDTTTSARIGFLNAGAGASSYFNLTTSWERYKFTTTAPVSINQIFHIYSNGKRYYITDIKVEKGNKATDWTPSPEDVDASISTVQGIADGAKDNITDIMSDLKVTPVEKGVLKREWDAIKAQYAQLSSHATSLGVPSTNYVNAYNALNSTTPKIEAEILASMTTLYSFTTTTKNTFQTKLNTYFTQAETLRKALTDKVQANANSKANQADIDTSIDKIEIGGRNLISGGEMEKNSGASEHGYYLNIHEILKANLGKEITISFDIRSPVAGSMQVYCSNNSRYTFPSKSIPVTTEYKRQYITVTPTDRGNTTLVSMIEFYGTYGTGRFWFVKNMKIEKGNKATDWTPSQEDAQSQIDNMMSHKNVRYIKMHFNGSTANTGNHPVELEVYNTVGTNIALNKTAITTSGTMSNQTRLTDGSISTSSYMSMTAEKAWLQLDLGSVYTDISHLNLWMYYADNRTYLDTDIQVSEDGVNYVSVYRGGVKTVSNLGFPIQINSGGTLNRISTAESKITSTAIVSTVTQSSTYTNAMNGKVTTSQIISSINQTAESIKINASKIDINGAVTFNSFDTTTKNAIDGKATPTDVTNAKNEAILHADVTDFGTYKVFKNTTGFNYSSSSITGYIIIETPITSHFMSTMKIKGYNYLGGKTNIDVTVDFYASTAISNTGFISTGDYVIDEVRIARNSGGKAMIILGTSSQNFRYPKISVEYAQIGHTNPPDSFRDGWSMSIAPTIPTNTGLVNVSGRDLNDTHNLTQGWRTTGKTTINGGAITADSIRVTTLSTLSANMGTVTAGTINGVTINGTTINGSNINLTNEGNFKSTNSGVGSFPNFEISNGEWKRAVGNQQAIIAWYDGMTAGYKGITGNINNGMFFQYGDIDSAGNWIGYGGALVAMGRLRATDFSFENSHYPTPLIERMNGDSNGDHVKIQSGGMMVIGAGESPRYFTDAYPTLTTESLFLTADSSAKIITNMNSGYNINRHEWEFRPDGLISYPRHKYAFGYNMVAMRDGTTTHDDMMLIQERVVTLSISGGSGFVDMTFPIGLNATPDWILAVARDAQASAVNISVYQHSATGCRIYGVHTSSYQPAFTVKVHVVACGRKR